MLKIAKNAEFTHKVKVRVPVDGGFADQEFTARFRVVPWSQLASVEADPAAQLRLIWVGWDGILGENDQPLPYSDAAREDLIDLMFVRAPVLRAYVDAVAPAKRGN